MFVERWTFCALRLRMRGRMESGLPVVGAGLRARGSELLPGCVPLRVRVRFEVTVVQIGVGPFEVRVDPWGL